MITVGSAAKLHSVLFGQGDLGRSNTGETECQLGFGTSPTQVFGPSQVMATMFTDNTCATGHVHRDVLHRCARHLRADVGSGKYVDTVVQARQQNRT